MQPLKLLVARYGALASKSSLVKESVARAVSGACGVLVEASEVELGDGEVRLRLSGARRAALFLKKDAATAAAAATLGKVDITVR